MQTIKSQLKRVPGVRAAYNNLREWLDWRWEWQTNAKGQASRQRMQAYHNRYKGQRCFILGNGPSLKDMDLSPLRDEITFGSNRVYLLFEERDFRTTFLASVNDNVISQFGGEMLSYNLPTFFSWRSRDKVAFPENAMFMPSVYSVGFSFEPTQRIFEGATITFIQMQLAFYMGFETVYLIGVDHYFRTQGPANKTVVSQGSDPNHFHPDYFGKGVTWQLPDLDTSEMAYALARHIYEQHDHRILDATVGGKLDIFPKVDYESLF